MYVSNTVGDLEQLFFTLRFCSFQHMSLTSVISWWEWVMNNRWWIYFCNFEFQLRKRYDFLFLLDEEVVLIRSLQLWSTYLLWKITIHRYSERLSLRPLLERVHLLMRRVVFNWNIREGFVKVPNFSFMLAYSFSSVFSLT